MLVVAFLPLLNAELVVWDDRALFTLDSAVLNFDLKSIFTDVSVGGYFPLTRLSYALDHRLFHGSARAAHLTNFALHCVNIILVYLVIRRLFSGPRAAARLGAGLFAVHPLNVEAVAWVSGGRKDLLAAMFFLSAALLAEESRPWRSVPAALAAFSAKATSLMLVPWLLLRRRFSLALALVLPALAVGVMELSGQRTLARVAQTPWSFPEAVERGLTSLGFAISRGFWPRHLAVFYERADFNLDALDMFIVVAATIWFIFRARRDHAVGRAGAWFGLLLIPVLKFIPFGQDSVFNDRYFYLPGVGLLTAVVLSEGLTSRNPRTRGVLRAGVVATFAVLAHTQSLTWQNQEALWRNVLETSPDSGQAHANLALYYADLGRFAEALPHAEAAVKARPGDGETASNLGVIQTHLSLYGQAEVTFRQALRTSPADARLWNNLGYVYLETGDGENAREAFAAALKVTPSYQNAEEGLRRAKLIKK